MKVKLSRVKWEEMGRKAGWMVDEVRANPQGGSPLLQIDSLVDEVDCLSETCSQYSLPNSDVDECAKFIHDLSQLQYEIDEVRKTQNVDNGIIQQFRQRLDVINNGLKSTVPYIFE